MTKKEAIQDAKLGLEVFHSDTNGIIKIETVLVRDFNGISSLKDTLVFVGDCSPRNGWESAYLGAR